MTTRLDPFAIPSNMLQLFIDFSTKVANAGLEKPLVELVKIRASQINGCGICLHMHTREARQSGESEERLFMLDAWRESSLYSAREGAALAWTEALTRLVETRAPDDAYAEMMSCFSNEESLQLTMLINVINSWNRIGVGYRRAHPRSERKAA